MTKLRAWAGRHRRRIAGTAGLLIVGVLAGAIGFSLQPAVAGPVGPGTVSLDAGMRGGDTAVALPPLGEILADTHAGPMAFHARVERIDVDQASVVFRGDDPARTLREQIEGDLRPLLLDLARQSALVAAVSGLVAGLVLPRRRVRTVATVIAGSLVFVAVSGAVAVNTFDPESFDHPRFEGALERAPDVINTVQRHIDDVSAVESRLEALADRVVGLYRTVEGDTGGVISDTTILHVSDIHSNPVGIELVEETAERFEVDAIVDTGDLTSFGAAVEVAVVNRIARIDTPYYVVPGNHDATAMRDALRSVGVEVLDPGIVEVGGVEILGVGDPTFTASNEVTRKAHERQLAESAATIRGLVLRGRPDVVAVHNSDQLAESFGLFDVGLAGHVHEPRLAYEDGSAIVHTGSAGATGVGALMTDEDLPYQMQLLHFDDGVLVAIDRLEFQGTDGAFQLQRVLVDPSKVDGYPDDEPDPRPLLRRPGPG